MAQHLMALLEQRAVCRYPSQSLVGVSFAQDGVLATVQQEGVIQHTLENQVGEHTVSTLSPNQTQVVQTRHAGMLAPQSPSIPKPKTIKLHYYCHLPTYRLM